MFVKAEQRSEAFRKFLAEGLTRTLVAARAREISARTGGLILAQIIFDLARAGGRADRVLDAPTNEAWIDPWVAELRRRGVDLRLDEPVAGHAGCSAAAISGVTTASGTVTADYYVAALPVEVMRTLAGPPLRALDPAFARLDRLVTRWMNGVLFYLDRDVPLVHGHAIYIDSEWALTSISQAQFWTDVDLGALRRRAREGDPLGRRLRLGHARPAHRQGRRCAARRRRSAPRSGASSSTTSTTARSTSGTSSPGSWTRRSPSRTRPAPPTSSRC